MIELVKATEALLRGDPVSRRGDHFTLIHATLSDPRPVRDRIPLLIGGMSLASDIGPGSRWFCQWHGTT